MLNAYDLIRFRVDNVHDDVIILRASMQAEQFFRYVLYLDCVLRCGVLFKCINVISDAFAYFGEKFAKFFLRDL